MRILQVIPSFNPKFGGPVTQISMISQKFAEKGHEVTILTTDFQFDQSYAKKLANVEIIPVKCFLNLEDFLYSPKIHSFLSEKITDFDIIHLHDYRSYQNSIVSNYAKKYNIPYVLQARGDIPYIYKKSLKILFEIFLGKNILKNAAKCIALTKTESDQYIEIGVPENKIVIIPNGIDISQFAGLPSRGQFRLKYQIPENVRIILSLGRIHEIKGIDLLVDAFSQIRCQMSNVKLVIVGPDGGFLSRIKQQVCELHLENDVIFAGALYGKDKNEAYVDADVFVVPSRYESFPNTVLEAWACGTPVIVTNGCFISDIVENAGYITAFDAKELKEVILKTFTDDEQRIKNIQSGLALIQNEFDYITISNRIEILYREVVSR